MVGITQNNQMLYFHRDPQKNLNNKKRRKGVSKSYKGSKTACKQEQCKLIVVLIIIINYDNK